MSNDYKKTVPRTNNCTTYNINAVAVEKRCPRCDLLLYRKVSIASGVIEIECPRCKKTTKINLAYRIANTA